MATICHNKHYADGSFSVEWLPPTTGNYLVNATYWGNSIYSPVFTAVNVLVAPSTGDQTQNVFSVESNSTVTSLAFNSESSELSFSVSGETGTTGYTEISSPKASSMTPQKFKHPSMKTKLTSQSHQRRILGCYTSATTTAHIM